MMIGGYYVHDFEYENLTDEKKIRLEEVSVLLRRGNLGLLDRALLEQEIKTEMGIEETEKKKVSKKERRKKRESDEAILKDVDALTAEVENPTKQVFLNRSNVAVKLTDVINESTDLYTKERKRKTGKSIVTETKWLIKRDAVYKIAKVAGLDKTTKAKVHEPSIDNHGLVSFDVTVSCYSDPIGDKTVSTGERRCAHGLADTTMLGEASDENTSGVSRLYKALTAERRGYVRAIFVHLGLHNLYGEDEFVEEGDTIEEELTPSLVEYENITELINLITTAPSKKQLVEAGEKIKQEISNLSESQVTYLRKLYEKNILRFEETI